MSEKKLKILIVDDEAFVRDMLADILMSGELSAEVETAENGAEALKKIQNRPDTDLIISDMNMPEMNGMELLRHIQKEGKKLPFIVLTGNKEVKVAIKALNMGASDYLLKDENIEDTIPVSVKRVLEKYRLEKENRRLLEELARKNKELERLSLLDGLTDIANRRYFDTVIAREWNRAKRKKSPMSLIMADIDYFKLYNDTYGHQEGDRCLKSVAGALHSAMQRPGDFLARYGGEEFAAILPDTEREGALYIAENMRIKVRNLNIPHGSSEVSDRVSLSIGVSTFQPGDGSNIRRIIEWADRALYRAKNEGRNRVLYFSSKDRREGNGSEE